MNQSKLLKYIIFIGLVLILSVVTLYLLVIYGYVTIPRVEQPVKIQEKPLVEEIDVDLPEASYANIPLQSLKKDEQLQAYQTEITNVQKGVEKFNSDFNSFKDEDKPLSKKEIETLIDDISAVSDEINNVKKDIFEKEGTNFKTVHAVEKLIAYVENEIAMKEDFEDFICVHCVVEEDDSLTPEEKWENYEKQIQDFEVFFNRNVSLPNIYDDTGIISETLLLFYTIELGENGTSRKTDEIRDDLFEKIRGYIAKIAKTHGLETNEMLDKYVQNFGLSKADELSIITALNERTPGVFEKYELDQFRFYNSEEISFLLYEAIVQHLNNNYNQDVMYRDFYLGGNFVALLVYLNNDYHDEAVLGRDLSNDVLTILDISLLL